MTRLMDIGIESYVIASAAIGVVAQRLVRRLCTACKKQYTPPTDVLRALNMSESDAAAVPFFKAVGCEQCHNTGYRGRLGIYEVMQVTDKVRRLIANRATEDQIREAAQEAGMLTLGEDALAKVKAGLTTAEELLRVVTEVKEMRTVCSGCGGTIAMDFVACPSCGKRLSGACPGCNRALQAGWAFCPYCARNNEAKSDRKLRGKRAPRELSASNVTEFKKGTSG